MSVRFKKMIGSPTGWDHVRPFSLLPFSCPRVLLLLQKRNVKRGLDWLWTHTKPKRVCHFGARGPMSTTDSRPTKQQFVQNKNASKSRTARTIVWHFAVDGCVTGFKNIDLSLVAFFRCPPALLTQSMHRTVLLSPRHNGFSCIGVAYLPLRCAALASWPQRWPTISNQIRFNLVSFFTLFIINFLIIFFIYYTNFL